MKTKADVRNEMNKLYDDARTGKVSTKDAERLSRILKRLRKVLPSSSLEADLNKILEE
ncbi:hypothetical protein A0J51_03279 [Gluconobacter japonicus]|nr:hypothetical protein A0J51_03279 [Gluconobacter japonicus]